MLREFQLTNHLGDTLRFFWDPDSGEMTGPDAERVRYLVTRSDGEARLTPTGPSVSLSDPLHIPAELALLLATHEYRLPKDLEVLVHRVYQRQKRGLQVPKGSVS
jgi:hypothetical protein